MKTKLTQRRIKAHKASTETHNLVKPDIMARLKATWGDRVFSTKEVAAMRAAEVEGEER